MLKSVDVKADMGPAILFIVVLAVFSTFLILTYTTGFGNNPNESILVHYSLKFIFLGVGVFSVYMVFEMIFNRANSISYDMTCLNLVRKRKKVLEYKWSDVLAINYWEEKRKYQIFMTQPMIHRYWIENNEENKGFIELCQKFAKDTSEYKDI